MIWIIQEMGCSSGLTDCSEITQCYNMETSETVTTNAFQWIFLGILTFPLASSDAKLVKTDR